MELAIAIAVNIVLGVVLLGLFAWARRERRAMLGDFGTASAFEL